MPYTARNQRREDGATAVEYAVMTALIGVVIMMGVSALGMNLQTVFAGVDSALNGEQIEPIPAAPAPPTTPVAPIGAVEAGDDGDTGDGQEAQPVRGTRGPGNNNAGGQGQGQGQGRGGR